MSAFEVISAEEFKQSTASVVLNTVPAGYADAVVIIDTKPCNYCGHCEHPNQCAWSRVCPKCNAPAGKISEATYCKTPTGGVTGLHAERWHDGS